MQSFTIDGIVVMPPLEASYRLDPTIETLKNTISYEQGYSYIYHNFLEDTKAYSFNKSSNFYLSQQTNVQEFFNIIDIPFEYPSIISTFLAFNRLTTDPLSALSANDSTCLTSFSAATGSELTAASATSALSADGQDTTTMYITISPEIGTDGTDLTRDINAEIFVDIKTKETLEQHYYFNIMFIDAVNCYIYHLDGDDRWYLSHKDESEETLKFTKVPHELALENIVSEIEQDGGDKIKFQYTKNESGLLRIYKQFEGSTHILKLVSEEDRLANPESLPVRLEDMISPDHDSDNQTNNPNMLELTEDTTLRIRPVFETKQSKDIFNPQIYNYTTGINDNQLNVDRDRTTHHKTNMLVHSEYYYLTGESIPINMFSLKNQQTPTGRTSPGNMHPGKHNYDHREYNKMFTGTNQLKGSSNISLEYNIDTTEYTFSPGINYFNTPQDMSPINRININDTQLISTGAIAGNVPGDSDKIFKKNAGYGQYTRWGSPSDHQLGTWLCTWLSGGDDPGQAPVWVDRYYDPDKTGYVQALTSSSIFSSSTYSSDQFDVFNDPGVVVDRPSKLTLEPGCTYAYYRLSETDIGNILSELDPYHVQQGFNTYTTTGKQPAGNPRDLINLDGNHIARASNLVKYKDLEKVSINFDINIDHQHLAHGHQILGNYTNTGIGIFCNNDISPFFFVLGSDGSPVNGVLQDSSLRIYDNNYKLYNYITNNSFISDEEAPGLFKHIIIRELPDNLYILLDNGTLIETTHDGVIQWSINLTNLLTSGGDIVNICNDERYIYILSHTSGDDKFHEIHRFDMISKDLELYDNDCMVSIDRPDFITNNSQYNYGRSIPESELPTLIIIKNDPVPYQHHRTLYTGTGDEVKCGDRYIWIKIDGAKSLISGLQEKHDVIYLYDTKQLKLVPGSLTDNQLADSTIPLDITDYAIDSNENIWLCHQSNILSKFNSDRKLLITRTLPEREILSLMMTRDIQYNNITERVILLSKTIGEDIIEMQIGPENHPTNDPDSESYRKASPWNESGNIFTRDRFINPLDPVYDDLSGFDDTNEIIYPLMDGNIRFGEQLGERLSISSDDTSGRIIDGDYEFITEGFDIFVGETSNILYGTTFDIKSGNLVEEKEISNFNIDNADIKPQLINHYEYSMKNFNRYSPRNLNLKLLLEPLFKKKSPDLVNLKLDLSELNNNPSTGFHNININIDNVNGRIELWIDGRLDTSRHVYEFETQKYRFNNLFNRGLICGASPYLNDTLLYNKLKDPSTYTTTNIQIRDFNMYTTCLDRYKQLNIIRRKDSITDLVFQLPCGSRNYIENIDKVFNHSIPPRKSNIFNIIIRNSSIRSLALQNYLSSKIDQLLPKVIPGDTKVRGISWSNELLEFNAPEADQLEYDAPVADDIIVDPSGITLPAYLPYILQ